VTVHKLHGHVEELHIIKVSILHITVHVMNTPSIRPVLNIKLMLLSIMHIINLMNRKLGNQLGLFRSSASGLADVRPLAAGQARIPRALPPPAAARQ